MASRQIQARCPRIDVTVRRLVRACCRGSGWRLFSVCHFSLFCVLAIVGSSRLMP